VTRVLLTVVAFLAAYMAGQCIREGEWLRCIGNVAALGCLIWLWFRLGNFTGRG
jgi:hypothetical protein